MKVKISLLLNGLLISSSANAYLGPGMGGGAIAAVLGLLVAILLGFFSILYYPIKRKLMKREVGSQQDSENNTENENENENENGR